MVAQLLRLRLRHAGSGIRRRSPVVVLLATVLLGVSAAAAFLGAVALRESAPALADAVTIAIGSFAVLGCLVVPPLLGGEDVMGPRRFALTGISARALSIALPLGSALGLPGLLFALVAAMIVIIWSTSAGLAALAVLAVLLGAVTCALTARTAAALADRFSRGRRPRELGAVAAFVLVLLAGPAVAMAGSLDLDAESAGVFGMVAEIVGWTPFGAAFSLPGAAASGVVATVVLKLLVAGATLVILWWAWTTLVQASLTSSRGAGVQGSGGGLGWFDLMPSNGFGGVAARSFIYWTRDPRYWVPLVVIPVVPFLMMPPLALAGVPLHVLWLLPLPFAVTILGWTLHNDVALDSSALWLHVSSGVGGHADRWGRHVPVLVIGTAAIAVGSMVTALLYGQWSALPGIVGVSAALFYGAMGVAAFVSARFPYPAVNPGDSPFHQPQDTTGSSVAAQAYSLLGAVAVGSPAIVLLVLGVLDGGQSWFLLAFVVGVSSGLLVLLGGSAAAARVLRTRGPELMVFATRR